MIRTAAVVLALAVALAGCAGSRWSDALTERDRALLAQATQQALENNRTGEGANWANPQTGHRGTVTPTGTFTNDDGLDCRDYQQTVTIAGTTRVGWGSACRHATGVWVDRRTPRLRRTTDVAWASDYYARPRLHFGFGYGHFFGRRHFGFGHHHLFGPYPWYGYPYYDPFYW